MANNAQKTPLTKALNDFAARKASDALQLAGKRLPVSVVTVGDNGATVEVKFEVTTDFTLPQITVPVETSIYRREPIQVGDKGWLQAADARLGGISGFGAGNPDLTPPTNLGALVFAPVGNKDWDAPPDLNKYLIQGPNGFYFRDLPDGDDPEVISIVGDKDAKTITVKVGDDVTAVLSDTEITLSVGDNASITIKDGEVDIVGTLKINGKAYLSHEHSGVQTGGGDTGPVVDP